MLNVNDRDENFEEYDFGLLCPTGQNKEKYLKWLVTVEECYIRKEALSKAYLIFVSDCIFN